jgi:hypothetical protein
MSILARWFVAFVETILGLVLAATPVALWVAWSTEVLAVVLTAAILSAVLLVLVHARTAEPAGRGPELRVTVLPDGFVEEVHQLFPLTHHHAWTETARFRRSMRRLRALVSGAAGGERVG